MGMDARKVREAVAGFVQGITRPDRDRGPLEVPFYVMAVGVRGGHLIYRYARSEEGAPLARDVISEDCPAGGFRERVNMVAVGRERIPEFFGLIERP